MNDPRSNSSDSHEVEALQRFVTVCEEFEADWRAGRGPRLDSYLQAALPPERHRLFCELLAIEIELRLQLGETAALEEYQTRYPEWAEAAELVFARDAGASSHSSNEPGSNLASASGPTELEYFPLSASGEQTVTVSRRPIAKPDLPVQPIPESFGRYTVVRLLGRGGFGSVYLARDGELGRLVAIKVPRPGLLSSPEQVQAFLDEARIAAGLVHPAIVAVYDVGRQGENDVFVVFEYVEGRNLASVLKGDRLSPTQFVKLMVTVAEAVHHAHKAGLVHRDIKPSNILIDQQDRPHIADFGLALSENPQDLRAREIAGTPIYMAPEQVLGETHRLDRRTDIWALGVVFYLGLLGRPPFSGRDREELFDEILHRDPKPLRQISDSISHELERISLKCLSKRMADRYDTAGEFADDLKRWLVAEASTESSDMVQPPAKGPSRGVSSARIARKGLRAFDFEDADLFLTLVPGPRDRDGFPDSIRAWKRKIDERDPDRTFTVGLLYGPSGSGKSSLVKAGLLPHLGSHVRSVYVEASSTGTESILLAGLRREMASLPADCRLDQAAVIVRDHMATRRGSKVLLVIDQFEQWLQSHPDDTDGELIRALRHCDGRGLQALLLVRDDFWMAITRFSRALEVALVEGVNAAPAEPFDPGHAKRVLAELGRDLGRFADEPASRASTERSRFLDKAVHELAGADGRVFPVRLTLFALMLRDRPWTTATLRELGGIEGIEVTFLEQAFSRPTAPPVYRIHQGAAQAVLTALLPDPSSDLRGRHRPSHLLQAVAGYADRPAEFADLIKILDNELRMVTPVDPTAARSEVEIGPHSTTTNSTFYQLTHDYLVPPLRRWLTRKERETREGRAALELATITSLWRDRPEARRLPSLIEWIRIVGFTRHRSWTADERRMMRAATYRHLMRWALGLAVAGALAYANSLVLDRQRAEMTLEGALNADYQMLPDYLPAIAAHATILRPLLEKIENDPSTSRRHREVAGILLFRDRPTPDRAQFLIERLLSAEPDELGVIASALAAHPLDANRSALEKVLHDETAQPAARLRAACALAAIEPTAAARWGNVASALAEALIDEHRLPLPK
jgi:eukaryotic-like serine/threonine-protein kinase